MSTLNICVYTALPNITTHPVSTTVRVRDFNVTAMSCSAIGIGPIYYRWEKYYLPNNSWINPSHRVINITMQTLKFSFITKEDEGVYHCVVISDNASVRVYGM